MVTVLVAVAIVPSAPVLVPELAGTAAAETIDIREAAFAAAAVLPDHWIAIGVGAADAVWSPEAMGTFAGFGVDVEVALSPHPHRPAQRFAELPLCALIAGWLRGQVRPGASLQVCSYDASHTPEAAFALGRTLRTEIDDGSEPVGVLVVADGCNTLSPAAPGGHDPAAVALQTALDDAIAAGDTAALSSLPEAVLGRVAFTVLAGLADPAPHDAKEHYRGAPYGVGYFVGDWRL